MLLLSFVAVGVVLMLLDRLLLQAEDRGWVFYRKRRASSGSVSAAAFGPVFDLLQPDRQVYVAEQQHQELLRDDAGCDEGAGTGSRA